MFKTFFFEIHAINEKLWKYFVEPERPHMTICRMRMASRIPKATNAPSAYVILTTLPLQHWLDKRASCYVIRTLHVLLFNFDSHKLC
jgi:hypothetical protein